jgi:nitronate monooxygenase
MGTRFVAAKEAGYAGSVHVDRILAATADDTVFTDVFDILAGLKWPDGISGRSIRTAFSDEWHGREDELQGQRDAILAEAGGGELPVRLHDAYAGQSSGLVHEVKSAADVIADIMREAEGVLEHLHK